MGFCPDYCVPDSNYTSNCGTCREGLKCRPSVIETPGKCIKKRGKLSMTNTSSVGLASKLRLDNRNFLTKRLLLFILEQKERSLQGWKRPALCNLNKKTGCEAAFPRFFFNKKTGKCEKFIYGGCGGNKNNFKKKTSCEITCGVIRGFSG